MTPLNENPDSNRHARIVNRPDAITTARSTIVHAPPRGPDTDQRDDGTLLTTRQKALAPSLSAHWSLQPSPPMVRRARMLVRRTLSTWNLASLADDAELLVSELTTNAILHAAGLIRLHLAFRDHLRCEVGDDDHTLPTSRHPLPSSETGRGLDLVEQLAFRWGSTRTQTGKFVWFELRMPADA
jgi:anti-sigma regulatory factor (Ser/Thr protein kinase)